MEQLTYTNSEGGIIRLRNSAPYVLINNEGTGNVDVEIQRQRAPFQDGATHLDSFLLEREIPLQFGIMAEGSADLIQKRAFVGQVFNPKLEGKLVYESGDYVREIRVYVDAGPFYPGADERDNSYQKVNIDLLALDPFWKSPSVEESPAFEPLFEFPFEGEFEMGTSRDARVIDNDGSAPAPLQIDFYGPAVNPRIENKTTGEFIQVNQTLESDEYMRIDTTPGQKSVVFVSDDGSERNVFNWIDLESTFFKLVVGENEIEYTADSDIQGAVVDITWQKLYAGV